MGFTPMEMGGGGFGHHLRTVGFGLGYSYSCVFFGKEFYFTETGIVLCVCLTERCTKFVVVGICIDNLAFFAQPTAEECD